MIIDFAQAQTIDLKNGQGLKITTSGQQACTVTFKEFSAGLTRDNNMSLCLYEGDYIYGRDGEPYAIVDSMNTQSMIDRMDIVKGKTKHSKRVRNTQELMDSFREAFGD